MPQLYLISDDPAQPNPPEAEPGKFCHCCQRQLPRDAFYRLLKSKDGLQGKCKECQRLKRPSQQPKSPNAGRDPASPTKWCSGCERELPRSGFERRERSRDGLQAYCRPCMRSAVKRLQHKDRAAYAAYHREWRRRNPGKAAATVRRHYRLNREQQIRRVMDWRAAHAEYVRLYERRWRKESGKNNEYWHRRRAAKRSVPRIRFTADQLAAKVAYWGHSCWICDGPYEAIDHVKPLTKGGPHALVNLRPVCRSCNSKKRNKWPFPWLRR